ncbi:Uncharacterized protein APZ42_011942 [Daphnia magna]|uniref:Uncharacterized protein n=1 Tax=Daphnia magna TaxID=35525 RepID=A0A162CYG3_9CRUS|nr:Uncharacterized protein APZ42_011942 [Daphnia magna]
MAQWPISSSQKKERVDFSSMFRKKPVKFWLSKVNVNEHRYKFDSKGRMSSYFGTQRTNIPNSVSVVACISKPNEVGCNLIRQVQTRMDSQQYIGFFMELTSSYQTAESIIVVHNKYPVYNSLKMNKWLGDDPRMSFFNSWPPASGDLMPIDSAFSEIVKEFDEQEMRHPSATVITLKFEESPYYCNNKKSKTPHIPRIPTAYALVTKQKPEATWKGWTCIQWTTQQQCIILDRIFRPSVLTRNNINNPSGMLEDGQRKNIQVGPNKLSFTATSTGEGQSSSTSSTRLYVHKRATSASRRQKGVAYSPKPVRKYQLDGYWKKNKTTSTTISSTTTKAITKTGSTTSQSTTIRHTKKEKNQANLTNLTVMEATIEETTKESLTMEDQPNHITTEGAVIEIIDYPEQTTQQKIPEAASLTLEHTLEVPIEDETSESGLPININEFNDKIKFEIIKMHEQYKICTETEHENKLVKEVLDVYCQLSTIYSTHQAIRTNFFFFFPLSEEKVL